MLSSITFEQLEGRAETQPQTQHWRGTHRKLKFNNAKSHPQPLCEHTEWTQHQHGAGVPLKVGKPKKMSLEMFPGQSRATSWEQEPSQRGEISWPAAGRFQEVLVGGSCKETEGKKKSNLVKMYFSINYHFTQFWSSLFPNYLCSTLTLKFHWVCSDLLYLAMFN